MAIQAVDQFIGRFSYRYTCTFQTKTPCIAGQTAVPTEFSDPANLSTWRIPGRSTGPSRHTGSDGSTPTSSLPSPFPTKMGRKRFPPISSGCPGERVPSEGNTWCSRRRLRPERCTVRSSARIRCESEQQSVPTPGRNLSAMTGSNGLPYPFQSPPRLAHIPPQPSIPIPSSRLPCFVRPRFHSDCDEREPQRAFPTGRGWTLRAETRVKRGSQESQYRI